MKKGIIIFLTLGILLAGCSKGTKNIEAESKEAPETAETENTRTPAADTDTSSGADTPEALTADAIKVLAAKHENLLLEDFAPYLDLSPLQKDGSLWEMLEFDYDGKAMCLRISASDKALTAAPYQGELDGAVVFQKEFLELETQEQEYAYEGSCADIRSGRLENILNGTVGMEDYLTVSIPEGLVQSGYKYWMGSHGGVAFLRDGENEQELTVENAGIYVQIPLAGGIEVLGNGELG